MSDDVPIPVNSKPGKFYPITPLSSSQRSPTEDSVSARSYFISSDKIGNLNNITPAGYSRIHWVAYRVDLAKLNWWVGGSLTVFEVEYSVCLYLLPSGALSRISLFYALLTWVVLQLLRRVVCIESCVHNI